MATLLMTSSHARGRPTFRVDEQLPVGHVVGSMADVVTSQDGGRGFSLLKVHGRGDVDDEQCADLFTLNSDSGIIRTGAVIDRERLCVGVRTSSCVVRLDVAILPRFDVVSVDVEIADVNDHAPAFGAGNATVARHVIESAAAPGPVFLLPVAVDPDDGDNGAVEYQLLPATSPFRLAASQTTDELTVELVESLDRETTYALVAYFSPLRRRIPTKGGGKSFGVGAKPQGVWGTGVPQRGPGAEPR